MIVVYILIAVWLAVGCCAYYVFSKRKSPLRTRHYSVFPYALAAAAAVRIVLSAAYYGHETDMGCFYGWSSMIYRDGMGAFYTSDSFTDYPPGYMYVLYVIGALNSFLNPGKTVLSVILKLPAAICDLACGYIIFKLAKKRFSDLGASVISAFYFFNPAVITDTSLWGQVDSVYTLFALIFAVLLYKKEVVKAILVFALCIFIKPQSLMLSPLIIFAAVENAVYPKLDTRRIIQYSAAVLGGASLFVLLSLPFGIGEVLRQYTQTVSSYPYDTVNAFNIWGAMGRNWDSITPVSNILGYSFIAAVCVFAAYVFFVRKSGDKYFFCGAVLIFGTFMLSTHMHERYAFAAMVFLLAGFCCCESPLALVSYFLISAAQFFNYAWVLFVYQKDINRFFKAPVIAAASFVNIIIFIFFIYATVRIAKEKNVEPNIVRNSGIVYRGGFMRSEKLPRMTRPDCFAVVAATVLYAAVAFANLGDTKAPQSPYIMDSAAVLDMGEDTHITDVFVYLSNTNIDEDRTLNISVTDSAGNRVFDITKDKMYVFDWTPVEINTYGRYIEITSDKPPVSFMEIAVRNEGDIITPVNADKYAALFDEAELVPSEETFMNSMYFDEIYHARTAYEFIHGLDVYEWTHPPLGKVIISVGIMIFGMCPFGWRFMGTLFGVLMVPIVYLFIKRMFKRTSICIAGCLLYTFDFMHFVQTRIATVDVYAAIFIMLMYMFMYEYLTMSFYDTRLSKTFRPLALSGICFGLAASCKWNAVYAAVGLAVIFFWVIAKRGYEYKYALQNPGGQTNGIAHDAVTKSFLPNTVKTIFWCVIFFVAVPICIYILSYIPFMRCEGGYSLATVLENQKDMYIYHSKTVVGSTHSFSSKWYEWIVMKRPMWYYSHDYGGGIKGGISTFGNPVLWWGGIIAVFSNIYLFAAYKDKRAVFLLIGYFSQLVFWMPIQRTTYIYHYFPMVVFLMLMICNCLRFWYRKNPRGARYACAALPVASVVLFIMFYPVLTGIPVSEDYVRTFLKWFGSWVLI